MILTCPACATRYLVDPAAIGTGGRTVRCARCKETWFEDTPPSLKTPVARSIERPPPPVEAPPEPEYQDQHDEDEAPPMAAASEEIVPIPPLVGPMPSFMGPREPLGGYRHVPALAQPRRPWRASLAGWSALLAVVCLVAAGLWFGRAALVGAWPPAERLYVLLGIPVDVRAQGLEVRNLTPAFSKSDDTPTLVVAGEVTNNSAGVRRVPPLRVTLRNAQSQVVRTWDFSIGREQLLAGETAPFQTSIANPPAEAKSALVTLSEAAP